MKRLVASADAARLQVTVHAIGDKANNLILNTFEEVARENPHWDRRWRIEHAQHLLPADIPRFAGLTMHESHEKGVDLPDERFKAHASNACVRVTSKPWEPTAGDWWEAGRLIRTLETVRRKVSAETFRTTR